MPEEQEHAGEAAPPQLGGLVEHVAALEDPRGERARLHSLLP
jgi:hypothetical protein